MAGYTPLFNSIITSSIWQENMPTRIIWITLLAMSDVSGKVEGSVPGLANIANVSVEECQKALEKLSTPDSYSRTKEYEGRRIHEIEGGWQIYNYKKFRDKAKSRAEYFRKYRQEKKVDKEKNKTNKTNTNNATRAQHMQHVAYYTNPPDKNVWNDIAFKVGLSPKEAELSYQNFKANGWKRSNQVKLESWEQVEGALTYWRNNRHQFNSQKESDRMKLLPIVGKTCSERDCKMPAVYKDTGGSYDRYSCTIHLPDKVKEKYY